jgi:ABC-type antimicrobial peptide transport system permease subunit
MLRHYFLTTLRTLRQNPLYTALSVFGIALTFVFVCFLFLMVKSIKGDFFPPNYAKRTWGTNQYQYQVNERRHSSNIKKQDYELLASKMRTPEIIVATTNTGEGAVMNGQNLMFSVLGVTDNYFDVCKFKFLRGRPLNKQEIADAAPVAVIDRNTANLYFGKNEDPIGKTMELTRIHYRVVGVVENVSMLNMSDLGFSNIWIPSTL